MKKIAELKKEYDEMTIPEELDFVVRKALKDSKRRLEGADKMNKTLKWITGVAAALAIFIGGINLSPAFAEAVSQLPVVGNLVKVFTFREFKVEGDSYQANLKVPAVEGMENKELQLSINEKYLAENKKLYEEFMKEIKDLEAKGGGHLGVDSGYEIKTDTEEILSIGRYVVETAASGYETWKFDTIDKKNQILLTLPSLFKDESYVDIISENIKNQMVEQYKADSDNFYWVAGIEQDGGIELFNKISEEQNFYINQEGKLVISFDKYEVAPGYMGVVEFAIPTDVLSDILVSNGYIK